MWASPTDFFQYYFSKLSEGHEPYPWQQAAFEQILGGRWPEVIPAPTGSGKTALMKVWALAFGWSRINQGKAPPIPRRLVWVVNNRVVVDQATEEAKKLLRVLECELPPDDALRNAFEGASVSTGPILAISTLRGQYQDNQEWKSDPTRPAVIIGTVDLIGSNLLFRGYREARYGRPSAAGLLGVDTVIVNDEAHLTPAFRYLLDQIKTVSPAEAIPGKAFEVIALSATPLPGEGSFEHSFTVDIEKAERFRRVVTGAKLLRVERMEDRAVEEALVRQALEEPHAPRTIVFVNRPEKALECWRKISKAVGDKRVGLLTGTMRGRERDKLTGLELFQTFQRDEPPGAPFWLVCTAAGEVGVNITSERLVTEMTTADRLQQRLGRLNRFGSETPGRAYLVVGKIEAPEEQEALKYFEGLSGEGGWKDASCAALLANPAPREAMTPEPAMARLEDRLLDLWAHTTSRGRSVPEEQAEDDDRKPRTWPVIPEVEPWLHGKQDDEAETEIAWRDDVEFLATALSSGSVTPGIVEEVLQTYRVLPHERLREPTYRVAEKIKKLPVSAGEKTVLIVGRDADVEAVALSKLLAKPDQLIGRLAYRLLLLPSGCGGIEMGMFQPSPGENEIVWDVADAFEDAEVRPRRRFRVTESAVHQFGPSPVSDDDRDKLLEAGMNRTKLVEFASQHQLGKPLVVPLADEESGADGEWMIYFPSRMTSKAVVRSEVDLAEHQKRVGEWAAAICGLLGLEEFAQRYQDAALQHDVGKDSELWQTAMGNPNGKPLAKTAGRAAPRALGGFRHEFRSMIEAGELDEFSKHLIATHHGYGRACFESKQYDRGGPKRSDSVERSGSLRRSEKAALEAACRYGDLQDRFGHWGLAYLEAVFKAADAMASEEEEGAMERKGAVKP